MSSDNTRPGGPLMVQSVAKAFRVLECFDARHPTMTLSQIAEQAKLDLSAAQRFTHTLQALGYLVKDHKTRQFGLSVKSFDLAFHYTRTSRLMDRALPVLQYLSKESEETINLTVLDGSEIVVIARFMNRHVLNTDVTIGSRLPAYCMAPGRAILSRMDAAQVEEILDATDLRAHTQHTITDRDTLSKLITQSQQQGYAAAFEELYLGDASVAAPILGADEGVVGAVSISASTARYSHAEMIEKFANMIVAAARSISFN